MIDAMTFSILKQHLRLDFAENKVSFIYFSNTFLNIVLKINVRLFIFVTFFLI